MITFDSQAFDSSTATFNVDNESVLELVTAPVVSEGQMIVTLSSENTTNAVVTPQSLGSLNISVIDQSETQEDATSGDFQISFNEGQTEVRSVSAEDTEDNVLAGANSTTVSVEYLCRPDIATCVWDPVSGAVSYRYVVTDLDNETVIIEGDTSSTSIEFAVQNNVRYECSVVAANDCGNTGEAGIGEGICVPPDEPTPTSTPTPTLPPDVTATPTPTEPPVVTSTPTPTLPPGVTATPTPSPTEVITATPTPSIPPVGSNTAMIGGAIGVALVILGAIALLAL